MNAYLTARLPQVIEICRKHKVTQLYAFGSILTDKFNDQSDVDFIVDFDNTLEPLERGEMY